jgi:hypothetical protein
MEVNQLVAHYKANYERKVFMTRLSHAMQNAYLMYIYDYPSELKTLRIPFWRTFHSTFGIPTILRLSTKMRILIRNL